MKAKIQARIYSSKKGDLTQAIPLGTPYSVHIDPCSYCNFKCKFCFQSDEKADKLSKGLMNFDTLNKIVNGLFEFPDKIKKIKIGLHGEPLLHPLITNIINYIKRAQLCDVIELFTNGFLLEPILNSMLISSGLDCINIAVEGLTNKQYKEMTGAKIYMGRFIRKIRHLYNNRGKCRIYIKTITQDKDRFFDMFGDICDEIFVENQVPQWSGIGNPELPDKGMYGQKIKQWKEVCPFIFMYLHYNWDGSVSPCTLDWGHKVIIGDANKETALEIWQGKKLKDLQIKMLEGKRREIPFCDKCLAPMVCCDEDLDDKSKELRGKI